VVIKGHSTQPIELSKKNKEDRQEANKMLLKRNLLHQREEASRVTSAILATLTLASSLLIFAADASAAQVTLTRFGSVASGGDTTPAGGGPFIAAVSDGSLFGPDFITFCLETQEHVYLGASNHYEISTTVKYRGGSTAVPLSNDTAYLYSNFRSGSLGAFSAADYTDRASLIALQHAIWAQEGLITLPNGLATTLFNEAEGKWSDLGNVRVMNLGTAPGNYSRQDQLAVVPIPAAAWLFGSALVGFVAIARRKQAR
jgi:hypothetical protein